MAKSTLTGSKLRIGLAAGFLLIAGAVTYGFFVGGWFRPDPLKAERTRVKALLHNDENVLRKKDATEAELYSAMIRLAQMLRPEARSAALAQVRNPSRLMRQGVATALGNFTDPEANRALFVLYGDSDSAVRLSALNALGMMPNGEREKFLQGLITGSKKVEGYERLIAASSLLRVAGTAELRGQAFRMLVGFLEAADQNLAREAAFKLMSGVPDSPEFIQAAEKVVLNSGNVALVSVLMRHLESVAKPWVLLNYEKLFSHPKPELQVLGLSAAIKTCAPKRWELAESWLMKQKNPGLLESGIRLTLGLGGSRATELLGRVKASPGFPAEMNGVADETIGELQRAFRKDPCDSQ